MDVLDLKFSEEFDIVVDKGEFMLESADGRNYGVRRLTAITDSSAMLTTKGDPWNPPEKDVITCTKEVDEALRVLRKQAGSKFV